MVETQTRSALGRLLIVRLGSLGDIVHALPLVAAIRRHAIAEQVDWLVDVRHRPLIDLVEGVDEVLVWDPTSLRGRLGLPALLSRLRGKRYDVALDAQGLIKSAVLARLSGARRVVGFVRPCLREPAAARLYTETVDPGRAAQVVYSNLALLRALGVDDATLAFPLRVPRGESAVVDATGQPVGEPFLLLNPGAAWPNKRWPADRFGALAVWAHDELKLSSVVVWGPAEEPIARQVVEASRGAARLAPPTTIAQLVALVSRAAVVVSGDTGPLHLAAAAGTPVVALFGPTDPGRNGPWRLEDRTVSVFDACGCHYKRTCRRASWCLEGIAVEQAIEALRHRVNAVTRAQEQV